MLDIRFIRENPDRVQEAAAQKGYQVDIEELLRVDESRRELQQKADELRTRRNEIATQMKGGKPSAELVEEGKRLKVELSEVEDRLHVVDESFITMLKAIPNVPLPEVPIGVSEAENVEIRTWGERPSFDFPIKNFVSQRGAGRQARCQDRWCALCVYHGRPSATRNGSMAFCNGYPD